MSNPLTATDPAAEPQPLALRPRDAAKALGVCPRTLSSWTKAGIVPHTKIGKVVLYSAADLQAWLSRRAEPANGGEQ